MYIPESKYWVQLRCVAALGVQSAEATEKEETLLCGCGEGGQR